jgi:hypothetical protein
MGVTVTPLGFRKPDGNEPVRSGDNDISANAQKAQDLIAELQARVPAHFDGGSAGTVFAVEQTIDGGTA